MRPLLITLSAIRLYTRHVQYHVISMTQDLPLPMVKSQIDQYRYICAWNLSQVFCTWGPESSTLYLRTWVRSAVPENLSPVICAWNLSPCSAPEGLISTVLCTWGPDSSTMYLRTRVQYSVPEDLSPVHCTWEPESPVLCTWGPGSSTFYLRTCV